MDVYGDKRGSDTYLQIAYTDGHLDCQYVEKRLFVDINSRRSFNREATYHDGYAECDGVSSSHSLFTDTYAIILTLNGHEYLTNGEAALANGPYPGKWIETTARLRSQFIIILLGISEVIKLFKYIRMLAKYGLYIAFGHLYLRKMWMWWKPIMLRTKSGYMRLRCL